MKVNFTDLLSISKSIDSGNTTFLFVGKGYPFSAAEMFAKYLSRELKRDLEFYDRPCMVPDNNVALFSSTEENPHMNEFITSKPYGCRIIPMIPGHMVQKSKWGKVVDKCYVVEVNEPDPTKLDPYFQYACALKNIGYTEEGINEVKPYYVEGWSSISHIIDDSETLKEISAISSYGLTNDIDYRDFKEAILFGSSWKAASIISHSEKYIEFSSRLINDFSTYYAIYVCDREGDTWGEISKTFGVNYIFLKTKLLPRLRSLGANKILNIIEKLTEAQKRILEGETVDPSTHMSSILLLALI